MKNQEVARLLYQIADLLELKNENAFKIRAYRRAAQAIESMSKPIESIAEEDKLDDIPGVGASIAEKILEYLDKGKLDYYERLKKKVPFDFEGLMSIEGLGPKKIQLLYKKLKIKSVNDLEAAAKAGKIAKLPRLGAKTEENILRAISVSRKAGKRMLLGVAMQTADEIIDHLKKSPHVEQVNYAGSLRRMKETIGDIDILASSLHPDKVIEHFIKMADVLDVIAKGPTKASVHLKSGVQVDLRVIAPNEYGSALLYFTGSKEHNIELRKIAIARRMKLSEYGLFHGSRMVASGAEEDIYKSLGLSYIEPEMREARGEIGASRLGKLPKLIEYGDILGDLQMHTKWSDGVNTIEEMAVAAKRMGYEYICITDHFGHLRIARALGEKDVEGQRKEIDKAGEKTGIRILHGAEIDIRANGTFDISNETLKKFDIVLASLHSALKQSREVNTARVMKAMENPHVDIIAHPTGRLIDRREGADLDIQKIVKKAVETNTFLEIDAYENRLDLSDVNARAAIEAGCKLVIDTDAHSVEHLRFMRLGVGVARRAWCEKKDVINTLPCKKLLKCFDIK